ncbi:hypothetical protein ACFWVH_09480, partial [Streptomyces sp. NPDC058656]
HAALSPLDSPADEEEPVVREPVAASRPPRPQGGYLAPGPHLTRSERTPVTPVGSRRPPQSDRVTRGTTSARPLTGG